MLPRKQKGHGSVINILLAGIVISMVGTVCVLSLGKAATDIVANGLLAISVVALNLALERTLESD